MVISVGGIPIAFRTTDGEFAQMLIHRYAAFGSTARGSDIDFEISLVPPETFDPDSDIQLWSEQGKWHMERGDFSAVWDSVTRKGRISQSPNLYSIDTLLRLLHGLLIAEEGGFLLHASSVVRSDHAFLFSGLSGAGKTTMVRLAPSDVQILTDEISYIKRHGGGYVAHGTPFAGDFGKVGENTSAPIAAVFLLHKANENRIDPVPPEKAIQSLMRNILFFARDPKLVNLVFESACAFLEKVPVFQLSFQPDQRAWDLIG